MKKMNLKLMAVMLLAGTLLASCSDEDDDNNNVEPETFNSIVDVASGESEFSVLVEALSLTGLDDALEDEGGSFTVFAPTNAAFSDLLDELDAESLDDIPVETLTGVLLYHVLGEQVPESSLTSGYYGTLSDGPEDDTSLSLYLDADEVMINGRSAVTDTDIMADNGIIHIIDEVLMPLSIAGHAVANDNLSDLAGAVGKAGLLETLSSDEGEFTVFAPVNSAFEQFLSDLDVTMDDLTQDDLTPVLLYHVMDGFIGSDDIAEGYFSTLSPAQDRDASIRVTAGDEKVMLNGFSEVILTDVVATNGIVHVIDRVVTPLSIVDIAVGNSAFSHLVDALVKAELVDALNGDGPFTVFAPTDEAFEELFEVLDVSGIEEIDVDTLTDVLLSHVVSGNVASSDLSDGSVQTLNEDKMLDITVGDGVMIDGDVNVILADVQGVNGIVHVIDQVIVP